MKKQVAEKEKINVKFEKSLINILIDIDMIKIIKITIRIRIGNKIIGIWIRKSVILDMSGLFS